MNRVFCITANQLKVFEWKKNSLVGCYSFKKDDEGRSEFLEYAKVTRHVPAKILLEVVEEEFVREKVPRLSAFDRKQIIGRRIKQHFHDSQFVNSQIIRRIKASKDDEYLFTSISNPVLLELWLGIIKIYKIPIVGIWSVPLISNDIIKYLPHKSENMLLVSRQMRSTVRESFFKHGKLIFSRQVRISRERRNERVASTYLSHSADQIHKFLVNQKVIGFNDTLDVACLLPGDLVDNAKSEIPDTESLKYQFLSLDALFDKRKIDSDWEREADALFAFFCSKKPVTTQAYLPKNYQKYYYRHLGNHTLSIAASFGSLVLATIATILLIENLEINREIELNRNSVQQYQSRYNLEYAAWDNEINNAESIQSLVKYADKLFVESNISPEKFFLPLSNILDDSRFTMLGLSTITWQKLHGRELDALRQDIWRRTTPNLDEYAEYEYNEEEYDDKAATVTLKGSMDRQGLNYRETVQIMEAFVQRLSALQEVDKLLVNRIPVDVRVSSKFQDQSGTDYSLRVKGSDADDFEIMLLLRPSDSNYVVAEDYDG